MTNSLAWHCAESRVTTTPRTCHVSMKTYKPTLKNAFGERRGKNLLGKIYMAIFFLTLDKMNVAFVCVCAWGKREKEREGATRQDWEF